LETALIGRKDVFQRIVLITFDEHGVSGHPNHRDTHLGVRKLVLQQQQQQQQTTKLPPVDAWQLDTVHFLPAKYLPISGWFLILLYLNFLWKPSYDPPLPKLAQQPDESQNCVQIYRSVNPVLSWKAMATHESQFVWYRRLFVVFSCYTFVNKLRPIR
jgi:N-acetylglucosaminylphosphatidylinositol deacetylase